MTLHELRIFTGSLLDLHVRVCFKASDDVVDSFLGRKLFIQFDQRRKTVRDSVVGDTCLKDDALNEVEHVIFSDSY